MGLCAHWHVQVMGILWKLSGKLLHVCSLKLTPWKGFRNIHLPVGHVLHLIFISGLMFKSVHVFYLGYLSLHIWQV